MIVGLHPVLVLDFDPMHVIASQRAYLKGASSSIGVEKGCGCLLMIAEPAVGYACCHLSDWLKDIYQIPRSGEKRPYRPRSVPCCSDGGVCWNLIRWRRVDVMP